MSHVLFIILHILIALIVPELDATSLCDIEDYTQKTVCPENWLSLNSEKCIRLFRSALTFSEARIHCADLGGTLASIHSHADTYQLNALASAAGSGWYWLGGSRVGSSFAWDDNSPFDYTNWHPDQPVNLDGQEDCVHGFYKNEPERRPFGSWNDINCDSKLYVVCQILKEGDLEAPCPSNVYL